MHILLYLGATAYVADYGELMNKAIGSDRSSRRVWHSIMGMISAFLIIAGWLIAWVVHEYKNSSHFAKGDPVYVQVGLYYMRSLLYRV